MRLWVGYLSQGNVNNGWPTAAWGRTAATAWVDVNSVPGSDGDDQLYRHWVFSKTEGQSITATVSVTPGGPGASLNVRQWWRDTWSHFDYYPYPVNADYSNGSRGEVYTEAEVYAASEVQWSDSAFSQRSMAIARIAEFSLQEE
jgi:hypothetical protein